MKRRSMLFALAATACSGGEWSSTNVRPTPPPVPTPVPPPPPAPTPAPPPAVSWTPGPINFSMGATFDLMTTLPFSIRRGGTFSVSSTGAALPAAIRLSPDGLLTATGAATVSGVVFSYQEPQ